MKTIKTSLSLFLLIGAGLSVSAQNVWGSTDVPTTTSGNVGISTTTPGARLDINSTSVSALKINHTQNLGGGNPTNIIEVYRKISLLPNNSTLINWLNTNGTFGLSSLSNTVNENRMMYSDKDGNLKSSGMAMYSSPTFGGGTVINSIKGVAYLSFLDSGSGGGCGFCTISGGTNGIYVAGLGVGTGASAAFELDVSGVARAQSFITTSDKRLKDNIRPLKDAASGLLNISSYSYTYKAKDENKKEGRRTDNGKLHFGFIAQEVEKEFPNLVSIDEKGNYALNYIEFIPLLLNELKSQKTEINDLKERMAALEAKIGGSATPKMIPDQGTPSSLSSLEQNVPNPFSQETVIRFNAEGERIAIGIYDLAGRQLQSIPVKKGEKQITVLARTLTPGTYIYNLMADGKVIDSKKMIVTQ